LANKTQASLGEYARDAHAASSGSLRWQKRALKFAYAAYKFNIG
jgi:hypothetical protein